MICWKKEIIEVKIENYWYDKYYLLWATGITTFVLRKELVSDFSFIILASGFDICFASNAPSLNKGKGAISAQLD